MTVKDIEDGDVLINSFNGGDPLEVKAECRRLGLLRDRRPDAISDWRETGRYTFRDANGAVVYRTVRKEKSGERKRFVAQRPDGRGGWTAGLNGVPRVLYRLPELQAAEPSEPIYLVEGERKADKLARMGFTATAVAFGAKGWRKEYTSALKGRTVIILPDNDDEGRGFAEKASRDITAAGGKSLIVELPGLPPKGDIIDWAGSADDLRAITLTSLGPVEETDGDRAIVSATPYAWCEPETIPPRPWVYGHWFLRGTVTAVVAPGGIGKTTLLSGSALSMITAQELLGKTVWEGRKRVWIWNLEDAMDELNRSIQAAAKHFGLVRQDVEGWLFVDSALEGATLCTAVEDDAGFRLIAPVFEAIVAELVMRKIDVLIIDPFVSSHEVEENANSKIDKIAKAWSRVAKAANCAIVLVHHTSKAGSGEVTALSARGAVSLVNACRSALVLNRMDAEVADRFGFDDRERRRYFTVQDDKHNRAPAENADWYRLASVDLGNAMGERPSDSVGVAEPWNTPDPFEGLSGQHLYRVQKAIDGGEWRENWQAADWVGNVVAETLGLDPANKQHRARILQMVKTWVREGALIVVERLDAKRMTRKFVEVGKWQNDTSATPSVSGAGRGVAVRQTGCPTTTPTFSGGVGRGGAAPSSQVRQNGNGLPSNYHAPILAPGDEDDEPFSRPPLGRLS
jgi:hypothetical protein